jgi:DNA invertase Pin-like site-specific DNA recombinase
VIFGYARVSTTGQVTDGNSLEQQEKYLKQNGAEEIVLERYTGTTTHRPKFEELTAKLVLGDTLIVTKLDRLARTTTEGLNTINRLISKGVKVNILNIGVMDNTPASELIRTIFLAFAQFERDMIVERTKEGKSIAKTKPGFKEGRPKKFTQKQIDMALDLLKEHSYTEVERMTKISKATLVRAMQERRQTE